MIINRLLFVHSERFNYNSVYTTLKMLYWHEVSHRIFYDTVFYEFTHMSNIVVNIQIMTEYTHRSAQEYGWNKDVPPNYMWDPNDMTSEMSFGAENGKYCLNHLTTKNSIKDSVLGAAFTNGICAGLEGGYNKKYKSQNVGFSSLSVRHTYLPEPVSLNQIQLHSKSVIFATYTYFPVFVSYL